MATLSVLAAALEATRKSRYAPASKSPSQQIDLSDMVRYPTVTEAELHLMSASITPALYNISCYEVMGASTHVVVVEESSPLTIPFIAAQETQVSTCFVWCSEQRRYTGVLSVTEYLKVLLYCEANPSEVERVSNMTVRDWLDLKRRDQQQAQLTSASAAPETLVSATADESLAVCIERMLAHKVRRLAVVADDADDPRFETSILTVVTYDTLVQHVANRLFSTDVFSNSSTSSKRGDEGNRSASMGLLGNNNASNNANAAGPANDGSLPFSVQKIVGGGEGDDNDLLGQDEGDAEGHDLLLLSAAVSSKTGAYKSIFDVPYARLPRLGRAAQYKAIHGTYPPPVVVGSSTPIVVALKAMIELSMHSIAVVDDLSGAPVVPATQSNGLVDGEASALAGCLDGTNRPIIDAVTRNDVIKMESGGVFNLQISIRDALTNIYNNYAPPPSLAAEGAEYMGGAGGPFSPMDTQLSSSSASSSRPPVPVFYETDTLREIIEHFATRRVPVLFLVDPKNDSILSQLSITEVFSFLTETAAETPN